MPVNGAGYREITEAELDALAREPYPDTGLMHVLSEMYRRLNGLERGASLMESGAEMLVLSHVWNTQTASSTSSATHTHDVSGVTTGASTVSTGTPVG